MKNKNNNKNVDIDLMMFVENPADMDLIEQIDRDEKDFILDRYNRVGATPYEKMDFIIKLKKLNNSYGDPEKEENYFLAFMEAKKVAIIGTRDNFFDFIDVATNPENFDESYIRYSDILSSFVKNIKLQKYRRTVNNRIKKKILKNRND